MTRRRTKVNATIVGGEKMLCWPCPVLVRIGTAALLAIMMCWASAGPTQGATAVCTSGAPAASEFCKYFLYFRNGSKPVDPRMAKALGLATGEAVRNIAII